MAIISWIIFGLVVGALARFVIPGRDPMGWLATLALGVAGSFVGGFLGNTLAGRPLAELDAAGFLGSLLGAAILVLLARRFRSPHAA